MMERNMLNTRSGGSDAIFQNDPNNDMFKIRENVMENCQNIIPLEVWDAGGSKLYFYTEDNQIADILKRGFHRFALYIHQKRIIAWQFLIPKKLESILIPRITKLTEIEMNKINDLSG